MSLYHCCDLRRLDVLRRSGSANAIEFLEVLDRDSPPAAPRQRTLFVRLLRDGFTLGADNVRIDGGERIPSVGVLWAAPADDLPAEAEAGLVDSVDEPARTLVVRTDGSGDFSRYRLGLVAAAGSDTPPGGFDPRLASITFSFKVECPSDFDCAAKQPCPPETPRRPDIDYLAKDYPGFRRLMLDRMSLLAPAWRERSAADLGVVLVELLAYAADNLSYRQDAVANEAYLGTARQRISVRRHARLVDYYLHEGCNARVFVHLEVNSDDVLVPRGTPLLTRVPNAELAILPGGEAERDALAAGALWFETTHEATLQNDLNRLAFYTWGDAACCLPAGSTSATLLDAHPALEAGQVLVFQELVSPTTFLEADADRSHRWAVRLTRVTPSTDPSGRLFEEEPVDAALPVTEIEWDAADALPFALCLGVLERPGLEVSIALGNNVLADHGRSIRGEALAQMPERERLYARGPQFAGACTREPADDVPLRYRPSLAEAPLSHGFDLEPLLDAPPPGPDDDGDEEPWWPAQALLAIDPRTATPRLTALTGTQENGVVDFWHARRDLLASDGDATDVAVEVDDAGRARLRFGDDTKGKRPDRGTRFVATYRVGNGSAGNVGAGAIAHIVSAAAGAIVAIDNPLPAAGGVDAEDVEAARRDAPEAFRTQERAVTAADYAAAAERRRDVQRAAASFRWTGSWHTVFVTPDRFGGAPVDAPFERRLRNHLERFRMAGYDLEVDAPRYVPLDVLLHICVRADYFRSEVLRAVRRELGSDVLPDGRLGVFHPDNFSFGESVYLSRIVAAARAVEGVESVRVERFRRLVGGSASSITEGFITMGRLEIAQLANNPNFPERGRLVLTAGGGK